MKMKNPGKIFEEDFYNSCPSCIWIKREKDNVMFSGHQDNMRFTMSSDYDFEVFNGKILYLLELKSTKGKSLSYSAFKKTDKYDQLERLLQHSNYENVSGGIIINFRENELTYYIPVRLFIAIKNTSDRKSISLDECKLHGEQIYQELKRTRYRYSFDLFYNYMS